MFVDVNSELGTTFLASAIRKKKKTDKIDQTTIKIMLFSILEGHHSSYYCGKQDIISSGSCSCASWGKKGLES